MNVHVHRVLLATILVLWFGQAATLIEADESATPVKSPSSSGRDLLSQPVRSIQPEDKLLPDSDWLRWSPGHNFLLQPEGNVLAKDEPRPHDDWLSKSRFDLDLQGQLMFIRYNFTDIKDPYNGVDGYGVAKLSWWTDSTHRLGSYVQAVPVVCTENKFWWQRNVELDVGLQWYPFKDSNGKADEPPQAIRFFAMASRRVFYDQPSGVEPVKWDAPVGVDYYYDNLFTPTSWRASRLPRPRIARRISVWTTTTALCGVVTSRWDRSCVLELHSSYPTGWSTGHGRPDTKIAGSRTSCGWAAGSACTRGGTSRTDIPPTLPTIWPDACTSSPKLSKTSHGWEKVPHPVSTERMCASASDSRRAASLPSRGGSGNGEPNGRLQIRQPGSAVLTRRMA